MRGNQVEFGDLGKFRLQIGSDGADSAADFKSDTHIKGVNSPGPELYSVFQDMEFVQVASRAVQYAALFIGSHEIHPTCMFWQVGGIILC